MKNKNKKNSNPQQSRDRYADTSVHDSQVQQRVFISLIIFSFVALGFGGWHIARQLRSPFDIQPSGNVNTDVLANYVPGTDQAPNQSLRDKDTDNDGLSDYDEFYIFKTSPYIADSDSDGIIDATEVDQGTDPNCPEGKDCGHQVVESGDETPAEIFSDLAPDSSTGTVVDPNSLTADELRSILRDAGASKEELASIPDDELVQTYAEVLAARSSSTGDGAESQDATTITLESLESLSIEEIRQFLVESGVPAETLNQVDDETLQQIFNESLQQNTEGEEVAP